LALGGNLGPVETTLTAALRQLAASLGPLRVASLYRSHPISPIPQPEFLNTAALARTVLAAEEVLALAKALELAAGRRPGARFGPRPLDVDLLLYGNRRVAAPELTLPHPRLRERRFMLAPLAEIAPAWPVPPDGATVAELLERLGSQQEVERMEWRMANREWRMEKDASPQF
jgi:2-amino-4-hydroxy-6-hydroxymethyldihydropteridine diphosphokinase